MPLKSAVKIVSLNFLILGLFITVPAVAFGIYKQIKLSLDKEQVAENLDNHPAYITEKERDMAKALVKEAEEKEKGSKFRSFLGWKRKPFEAKYQNVLDNGYNTRLSTNSAVDNSVWFFGGSIVWGAGSPDNQTIPSYYAQSTKNKVLNLGESAWTSRQSLNQLIDLLGDGHRPKRIIFYEGSNDILHGCRSEIINAPSHSREAEIDKMLSTDGDWRALSKFNKSAKEFLISPYKAVAAKLGFKVSRHQNYGAFDCSTNPPKADKIASHLVNNWYVAYNLAKALRVEFTGILNPNAFVSNKPTKYLQGVDSHVGKEIKFVYPLMRNKMIAACQIDLNFCQSLVDGSSWLDNPKRPVYFDFSHLNPAGNKIISDHIIELHKNQIK